MVREVGAAVVLAAALAACDGGSRPVIAVEPTTGAGGATIKDAGPDVGMGGDGGESQMQMDGGASPVRVGVAANARALDDARPTSARRLEAELEALAAGSRVRVVSRRWRAIDAAALDEIAASAQFYAGAGVQVVFELAIVDGLVDGRPDSVAMLPWDDAATKAALEATLGDVLGRFGEELAVVAFGRDVDVYLDAHSAERVAFEAMMTQLLASARSHPAAQEGLAIGAGFSSAGALVPDASFPKLLAASDVAVLSHAPSLRGSSVPSLAAVDEDLDAIMAAVGQRPTVLASLAYPSSDAVGSSPDQQQQFFASFFDALALRRAAFPWVHVVELYDRADAECDEIAAEQGDPPGGAYASFVCSRGLRDAEGVARPAWATVKSGLATFATP